MNLIIKCYHNNSTNHFHLISPPCTHFKITLNMNSSQSGTPCETCSVCFLALLAVTRGQEVLKIDYLYYAAWPSVHFPHIDTNMRGMLVRSQISQAPWQLRVERMCKREGKVEALIGTTERKLGLMFDVSAWGLAGNAIFVCFDNQNKSMGQSVTGNQESGHL